MTFLSVARFGIPAVVSISVGISPWFSVRKVFTVASPYFFNKEVGTGIVLNSFIIHEPADSKDEKFFNNSQ